MGSIRMRKFSFLLLFAWICLSRAAVFAQAERPDTVTSVQQVTSLSDSQAALKPNVNLDATVTYVRPSENKMFVMENGYGSYVRFPKDLGLEPGDLVEIVGTATASFHPVVEATEVRLLSHGPLPKPRPANFADLIRAKLDAQLVWIDGRVLSAEVDGTQVPDVLRIRIKVPEGTVDGVIAHPGRLRPEDLLDADVRVTGVAGGAFDGRMQMAGVWLDIYSDKSVIILRHPAVDPWTLPSVPLDQVVFSYRDSNASQRARITGTLTYYEPGELAVVERQGKAILVQTYSSLPLHPGDAVEATGFPAISDEHISLQSGELRPMPTATSSSSIQPVLPQKIAWESATIGAFAYNLVNMEGEVVGLVHDSRVDEFLIQADGHMFSATLRHSSSNASDAVTGAATPSVGSRVRVTGVCFVDAGNHWRDRLWFDLRMRSLADVVVLQQPSWWTVKRLANLATALSIVILIAVIWAGWLDRRLRQQTAVLARQSQEDAIRERRLARQEQQRSHILELISSAEPLSEVLREIQSMVSSRLFGAATWFELNTAAGDSAELERPAGPAIVFRELFSPDGSTLGFLMASPLLQTGMESDIAAALVAGARLAELAIDTRRLYSDLRHRSEYDLLTDIPNRFSLEKQLDQLLSQATRKESIFGLVYVDLDRFKQVNDRYGHRAGDLYLQESTRRMKLQLRAGDVLARIGGDEFIALAPILRSRADAEEIAMRLERCFEEPFQIEGYTLLGSASVGLAVYPQDGLTKEELQRSADVSMYAHKQGKKADRELTLGGFAQ